MTTTTVYVAPDDLTPAEQDWRYDDVTERSVSAISGYERISQTQRRRLLASLVYADNGRSIGRLEALRDFLRGGANCVQLKRCPDGVRNRPAPTAFIWKNGTDQTVTWRNGAAAAVTWQKGTSKRAIKAVGSYTITLPGFSSGELVAVAGELVELEPGQDYVRVIDTAYADSSGDAIVRVQRNVFTVGDLVTLSAAQSVIMRPTVPIEIPRNASGTHDPVAVQLRQVFTDELGEYVTVTPWS
jgi:hypothetical protein